MCDQSEEMCDSVCARLYAQRERVDPRTSVRTRGENVGMRAGDVSVCVGTARSMPLQDPEGATLTCVQISGAQKPVRL